MQSAGFPIRRPKDSIRFDMQVPPLPKLSDAFVDERCLLLHLKARQNALTTICRDNLLQSPCQCQEILFYRNDYGMLHIESVFLEGGEG